MLELNPETYAIIFFILGVLVIGLFSLIGIGILFKHAEKRSVAVGVTTTYLILFAITIFAATAVIFVDK